MIRHWFVVIWALITFRGRIVRDVDTGGYILDCMRVTQQKEEEEKQYQQEYMDAMYNS